MFDIVSRVAYDLTLPVHCKYFIVWCCLDDQKYTFLSQIVQASTSKLYKLGFNCMFYQCMSSHMHAITTLLCRLQQKEVVAQGACITMELLCLVTVFYSLLCIRTDQIPYGGTLEYYTLYNTATKLTWTVMVYTIILLHTSTWIKGNAEQYFTGNLGLCALFWIKEPRYMIGINNVRVLIRVWPVLESGGDLVTSDTEQKCHYPPASHHAIHL